MNKGFLVLAQNSDVNYVRQAYFLALSLKQTQSTVNNISLVTNDKVPDEYAHVFDKIIPIPFGDHAENSTWKVENRWKLYHATPYEETIVFDSDMLVLSDLKKIWQYVDGKDLFFTSHVKDYRGQTVFDKTYRKMFLENDLPNLYCGMFYFRKSDLASKFFKVLEFITYNWEKSYFEIAPKAAQKFFSMDVSSAIAAKILGIDDIIINKNSPFTFVHMKPALQGWDPIPESFLSQSFVFFSKNKELFINHFKQSGVFHYVEDAFLTDKIIGSLNV